MTKPNIATIFRKRQVLPAKQLTQAMGQYGTLDGAIPYDTDSKADTSFSKPLGTKTNPFGNAFFKGFNIYTQLEVQELVSGGKLSATDRFVFWNTTTETLCAWNGTEIITLTGGKNNMDYLFGDGSDGDVTMVADGSYDRMKNFKNFTLNSGITLSKTTAGSPLIIRCTGTCTISGTINLSGKGFSGGSGGADGYGYSGYGYSAPSQITGLGVSNKFPSGSIDLNAVELVAASLNFDQIPWCGGGGGGAASATNATADYRYGGVGAGAGGNSSAYYSSSFGGGASATGGNGGGGLLIIARKIIMAGVAVLTGTAGSSTNSGSGTNRILAFGGGGGGGCAAFIGNEISITGTVNCSGGAAGGSYSSYVSGAGGNGGYIKLII